MEWDAEKKELRAGKCFEGRVNLKLVYRMMENENSNERSGEEPAAGGEESGKPSDEREISKCVELEVVKFTCWTRWSQSWTRMKGVEVTCIHCRKV